jgi:hypothetical protein
MLQSTYPTQFKAKRWIFYVETFFTGSFGIFSLIMGPLFLFGMKDAKGETAKDAGFYLTIMSVPFLMIFSIKLYRLMATREPILNICQEGVVKKCVALSSLDNIPMIPKLLTPKLIQVFWLALSGQGFRSTRVCIPWKSLQSASVSGLPMARILTLDTSISFHNPGYLPRNAITVQKLSIYQVELKSPLEEVSKSINYWASRNTNDRKELPSWF